ncbi:MAG: Fe-S cluster assembly protein SufD [Flavisolibacter sp.]
MNTIETIREKYQNLLSNNGSSVLTPVEQNAFDAFNTMGIPTAKHEEWKYTRISSAFNKEYAMAAGDVSQSEAARHLNEISLPGHETANELVFINGLYAASLSNIRSEALLVESLEEAVKGVHKERVLQNLGHSSKYIKDGIHALNTAFVAEGIFIYVKPGLVVDQPLYIYNITDATSANILAQPRTLVYVGANAIVQIAETYATIGMAESFTNQVMEIVVEQDAIVDYYKIQNDGTQNSQVSTTHFRQTGKSLINAVTISLNGGIIRNNLNIAMEASHSEAHMYGLYFLKGQTHVDNHTVVDNVQPNCQSNELYKGIIDDNATAVFNGKIFVQQIAQKTNAFQSNKNILLSDNATVNTKPQLEIFADDVKCSHGCTIGQLDEEGLFYLRSRGISERAARSLLIRAFAIDILDHIKPELLRNYIDGLISERLEFEMA